MTKHFALVFIWSCFLIAWCQSVSATESFSVELTGTQCVYITIQEGCTELSNLDLSEIDQYEQAIIQVPDSFRQIDVLSNRLNAVSFQVSKSHPELSSYDGCLYSKSGETFLLQPPGQNVRTLRIREGTIGIAPDSLMGKANCLELPSTLVLGIDEVARNGNFAEIQKVVVHDQNPQYVSKDGVLYSKDMKTLIYYPSNRGEITFDIPMGVEYIGEFAFAAEQDLEYVRIPDSVLTIGDYAFWFTKLRKVEGCHGVVSVGKGAFEGSLLLKEIQGMENLETMKEESFSATALSVFVVNEALSTIPSKAFYDCHDLRDVSILSTNTTIADDAFSKSEAGSSDAEITIHCFSNSYAELFARNKGFQIQFFNQE